jgi:DNA polymerase-1
MLAVDRRLSAEKLPARLLLQVHDELILEVPESEAERVSALVEEEMAAAIELDVPLKVSVERGRSWGELH